MITIANQTTLRTIFDKAFKNMNARLDTRSYMTNVMLEQLKTGRHFLGTESVVLLFDQARQKRDFETFQMIGDWILWLGTIVPSAYEQHESVYESLGRISYYRCYDILRRSWPLYEELADELPRIIKEARFSIKI